VAIAALASSVAACGSTLPTRYVIERDVEPFAYRRYQKVLDVDIPVPGNDAVGHTATYVRRDRTGTHIALATAFVTVYANARSLAAEVADSVHALEGYRARVEEVGGGNAWVLVGEDDRWALWVSGNRVVKIGAPTGEALPVPLVEAYLDLYPSDLDEHGRAVDGAPSVGPPHRIAEERDDLEMPAHLREGAPR